MSAYSTVVLQQLLSQRRQTSLDQPSNSRFGFSQFGSDLDKATQEQLANGERQTEMLKQGQYKPNEVINQCIAIFAGSRGFLDDLNPQQRVSIYDRKIDLGKDLDEVVHAVEVVLQHGAGLPGQDEAAPASVNDRSQLVDESADLVGPGARAGQRGADP